MAIIGVNSGELSAIGGRIQSILGEYDGCVSAVRSHAADIISNWRGEAMQAFESQMSAADGFFNQIRVVVEQYAEYLSTAATKYDSSDAEAAGIVRTLHA